MVNIPHVQPDGMFSFDLNTFIQHELIFLQRRTRDLVRPIQPNNQQVNDESIKLEDEGSEL